MFTEELQIDLAMAVVHNPFFFEEIAGKRRTRDHISGAGMQRDVVDARDSLFDQRPTVGIGKNEASSLTTNRCSQSQAAAACSTR